MLIALDERTLYQNIISEDLIAGSGAGDIILIQNIDSEPFDDEKYSSLPDIAALHKEPSFQSKKSKTESLIHKVMISEEIYVNGHKIPCDKSFVTFIREATSGKKKVTFTCQSTRSLATANADNNIVLTAISEYMGHHSFTVEALEYIEGTNSLNFIIFDRGYKADFSQVFAQKDKLRRGLKGYPPAEINHWSNTEFSLLCMHILRQYSLTWLAKLLVDERYCKKRFKLTEAVLSETIKDNFFEEAVYISDRQYYVQNNWSLQSRIAFWNWLLDRISEKSNDVFEIILSNSVKVIKIPNIVTDIDYTDNQIAIPYKISYSVAGKIQKADIKDIISKQKIYQHDKVILVDETVSRLLSYTFYNVKYIKEQEIILTKENTKILPIKENEILDLIRKEELNNEY